MQSRIDGRGVAFVVLLGTVVLGGATHATAASKVRECRDACENLIARCTEQGFRRRFCAREVVSQCVRGRVDCRAVTTTLPVCVTSTTSTTLPNQADNLGPAGCQAEPSGVTSTYTSADDMRQRLVGAWYDCKTGDFAPGYDGIEFTLDGQYYLLKLQDAALVRKMGFGEAGTYTILDTSLMNGPGHFQLNLNINNGFYQYTTPSFSTHPRLLLFGSFGGGPGSLYSHMPATPTDATETR